ncbi:hypothetical protein IE53DRAFT_308466 [Violaceomyces palustris]|uniref:Uncharacterized protein n=1 Tax=Violaceomyces palustris TaxID=1673888 RepID=A0ACD0P8D1_9BASI|nr:hypothetical protein IE53DRAFT_308466 [Violaceomyces palustris]
MGDTQDTTPAYPPRQTTNVPPRAKDSEIPPSSSLQRRLFGSRGIAAFTIDTGPLSQTNANPTSERGAENQGVATSTTTTRTRTKRGRWHTLEFKVYGLVFLIAIPIMVWVPISLSQPSNPNYYAFSWHLKKGWIAGRLRDDSDFQYRSFRDYTLPLAGIMALYLLLSKLFVNLKDFSSSSTSDYQRLQDRGASSNAIGDADLYTPPRRNRLVFLLCFTTIFVLALHGTNALKLVLMCALNFALAKALGGTRLAPVAIWALNVAALFTIHWNDGIKYASMSSSLAFLDGYQGLLPRWQINYNITMLRLVSFSLDLHWARQVAAGSRTNAATTPAGEARVEGSRERTAVARPLDEYSFRNYIAYVLYPPLFIAGPIMTFNDWTSQLFKPLKIPLRTTMLYAIRFLACLMTMELILHFIYVNAIKDSKAWQGATPLELSMIGFWNLIIVWLKVSERGSLPVRDGGRGWVEISAWSPSPPISLSPPL